jgi:ABC-type branched-subunit amino acid transport system ATPase component/branched-subunit amino acid ABC-type transport system permease component
MSDFLVFVIAGLGSGAVYALSGVGLVLTYRTSGVFNFAYGAFASIGAYCFYTLLVTHGWRWEPAALVATVGVGVVLGILIEPLARRLRDAQFTVQVAGTVGLLLAIEAVLVLVYGTAIVRNVPEFLTTRTATFFRATVPVSDLITLAIAVVVTVVLSWWLKRTGSGRATRAVVDDASLLDVSGMNPNAVRRLAWIIGSTLAAGSGVLFAPLLPLNPGQLTLLVVAAFGAAAVGRFVSLPLTCAGGLLIGVLASLATRYITAPSLGGISSSVPFLVLFLVICVLPKGRSTTRAVMEKRIGSEHTAPLGLHAIGGAVAIAALATVPSFAGVHLTSWTIGLADVVMFLSLALLVRTSGQVSLCQITFVAIGAAAFSHLATGLGLPWFLAMLVAGAIAVPIGAVLAIPAIRQSGLYLALATFGFGILVEYLFYPQSYMFGSTQAPTVMPRPALFGSHGLGDKGYYYLVLVFAVVASVVVMWMSRSRLGRLLRGIGDAPLALETTGTSVTVTRVLVFCIAAFLAAIAGVLSGVAQGTVSELNYPPLTSLTYFAVIIVVVGREPWNALAAALPLDVIPSYFTSSKTATVLQLIFGVAAVLVAVLPPAHINIRIPFLSRLEEARQERRRKRAEAVVPAAPVRARTGQLDVHDVTVAFGGVVALDGVSLSAPVGRVTGLIGPNGAGKTTMFNACSGLVRPKRGQVKFQNTDFTSAGPGTRGRHGLGRTFQQMQLYSSMTVRENVALGREARYASLNPLAHLITGRRAQDVIDAATRDALEACGLTALAERPVASLSTGQQRLVDLARCLAGGYDLLLLDEPSSGLDQVETAELGEVVRRVVAERGIGVLLVEHDLSLVVGLCDHIYVLDFGKLVMQGTPAEVVASEVVRAVYLGDSHMVPALDAASA